MINDEIDYTLEDPHPNPPPQGVREQEALSLPLLPPSPLAGEGLGMGIRGILRINAFSSDRLTMKISDYNQKRAMGGKAHQPLSISDDGLELIEYLSLDCTNTSGVWQSDTDLKIDKNGFVTHNGTKTKTVWDGTIPFEHRPKRLKVRNIAGDETIITLEGNN